MPSTTSPNVGLELMATGEDSGTWGTNTNANLSILDLRIGGRLSKSVAGASDVNLSTSETQNGFITLTGLLTGNIAVNWPSGVAGLYVVTNSTTGAFSITLNISGGTGIVIPQSVTGLVFVNPTTPGVQSAITWVKALTISTTATVTGLLTLSAAMNEAQGANIASVAGTTDIGAATGNYVKVTGTNTITGLGTIQAGTRRIVEFTGALILTHNATSLILPGAANITTTAGDVAVFVSEGSGNWRCVQYMFSASLPLLRSGGTLTGTLTMSAAAINEAVDVTIASASTVNIGAAAGNNIIISGTTTITAFDTVANGVKRFVKFSGALTLTHNGTSLILPGGANITTAANDTALFESLGSGNWICHYYKRQSGLPVVQNAVLTKSFTSSQQTITAGGSLTLPHSLGAVPAIVQAVMHCTSADGGYSSGDEVIVMPGTVTDASGGVQRAIALKIDATNVTVYMSSGSSLLQLCDTDGSKLNITNTKWKIIVKAFA